MKKKLTRITGPLNTMRLVDVVAADLDVPTAQAHEAVMTVFSAIARANAGGHKVAITNFGTFLPTHTKERIARNPQTGELFTAAAHQVTRFRISDSLAAAVRRRDRRFSIRKQPKRTAAAAATASE
jgi:nucleoid DNA-binding protein